MVKIEKADCGYKGSQTLQPGIDYFFAFFMAARISV